MKDNGTDFSFLSLRPFISSKFSRKNGGIFLIIRKKKKKHKLDTHVLVNTDKKKLLQYSLTKLLHIRAARDSCNIVKALLYFRFKIQGREDNFHRNTIYNNTICQI